MKKLILMLLLFNAFLVSCKQEANQLKTHSRNETSIEPRIQTLEVKHIDSAQFPRLLKYEGFVKNAVRWKDKLGDNIVITTETGNYRSEKFQHEFDESGDAELFGYHFLVKNGKPIQIWKVCDYIQDCPVDIVASFVKNSFEITDLDNNGIAEIWLMYKTICHGDVSPCEMKIIMYEGKQKFAMRGESKVQVGIGDNGEKLFEGGNYKFDTAFEKSSKTFKDFALNLWNKNII